MGNYTHCEYDTKDLTNVAYNIGNHWQFVYDMKNFTKFAYKMEKPVPVTCNLKNSKKIANDLENRTFLQATWEVLQKLHTTSKVIHSSQVT